MYCIIGTSRGLVLVFGKCAISTFESFFYFLCADKNEHLKCVLTPYGNPKSAEIDGMIVQ